MSYAVLMAYVDADGMPEQRVRLAASLADKFNATLIGLSAPGQAPLGAARRIHPDALRRLLILSSSMLKNPVGGSDLY
jgi:hypothetical protein